MHTLFSRVLPTACWVLACAPMAWAAPQGNIPAFQSSGAVQYSCGGIGLDESTAMRDAMKEFPLSLLFARKDGAYQADLAVEVKGSSGEPARFTATGPVCLIRLPAGHYSVTATPSEGAAQTQAVDIKGGGHTLDFRF